MDSETNQGKQDKKAEKAHLKAIKIKENIEKFGFQEQVAQLQDMGYTNEKLLFKSLKKNKGDLVKAVEFIHKKQENKEKGEKKDETITEGEKAENDKEETKAEKKQRKMKKKLEKFPQFPEFDEKMKGAGFSNSKKNLKALKKSDGDIHKAEQLLHLKDLMEKVVLKQSISKGEYQRVVVDCSSCLFLESNFFKKAKSGNLNEVENKIANLLRIFQVNYGPQLQVQLVFENSGLVERHSKEPAFGNFIILNSKPFFQSTDDLIVDLALVNPNNSLFISSDRMVQARLLDKKVPNIMASNVFFRILKKEIIGSEEYSKIIDA